MNVYFRSPELNGGCLFDGYVYTPLELPSGERLIFRSPHIPGVGCIFADPSEIEVSRQNKGAFRWEPLFDQEEEIIAAVMAVSLRRGYGGNIGVKNVRVSFAV